MALPKAGEAAYDCPAAMESPQFRASWSKFVLRCTKRIKDPTGALIAEAVPDDLRREIREVGHLGWHEARVFMDLLAAIHRVTGDAGSRAFWRESFIEAITQPLISPLARGALTLWGSSPGSLVRRNPEAWIFFTRYCGTLRAVATEETNGMVLRLENLAPICRAPSFIYMVEGGLESELDYVRASGTVEIRADRFSADGFVDFVVRW